MLKVWILFELKTVFNLFFLSLLTFILGLLRQSLVISEGMCLAIETLPGTDKMLDFVKDFRKNSVSNFSSSGILFKSKKFNQETKIDMPVVGPNTVKKVKDAKLDGIVLEENSVIIIDKELSIKLANDFNIFICSVDFKKLNKYYE